MFGKCEGTVEASLDVEYARCLVISVDSGLCCKACVSQEPNDPLEGSRVKVITHGVAQFSAG
eukprot:4922316-Pyramimonas_sp.AAC.1